MPRLPKKEPEKVLNEQLSALTKIITPDKIRELADKSGFIIRDRKVDPVFFFWNLILGFACSAQRTLAALKRQYATIADTSLALSSFFERFDKNLIKFLKLTLTWAIQNLALASVPKKILERFSDVSIFDSTVVALCDSLAKIFPGVKNPAEVKISLILSVVVENVKRVAIYAGKKAEIKTVRLGNWVKNNLLLFDLGFFKYRLFARIIERGGHFISRMKGNANPTIVKVYRQWRGQAIDLVGKKLKDVISTLKREVIDAEVEIEFNRQIYGGNVKKDTVKLRLVGILDPETEEYHLYLTDLPSESFPPELIAELYRGRWFIEMLFKELKSRYALDVLVTSKRETVEALIYSALLTLAISRRLYVGYKLEMAKAKKRITPLRWATFFFEASNVLLLKILEYSGIKMNLSSLLALRLKDVEDPNPDRERLEEVWNL